MMATDLDISSIVGITLMVIGGMLVSIGLILCYTTKGEYYNQDEVQAMVAAEVLEEEKKKKIEEEEMKEEIEAVEEQKKRKRRGPLVAA